MSQEVSHRSPQLRYPSAGLLRRTLLAKTGYGANAIMGLISNPVNRYKIVLPLSLH